MAPITVHGYPFLLRNPKQQKAKKRQLHLEQVNLTQHIFVVIVELKCIVLILVIHLQAFYEELLHRL